MSLAVVLSQELENRAKSGKLSPETGGERVIELLQFLASQITGWHTKSKGYFKSLNQNWLSTVHCCVWREKKNKLTSCVSQDAITPFIRETTFPTGNREKSCNIVLPFLGSAQVSPRNTAQAKTIRFSLLWFYCCFDLQYVVRIRTCFLHSRKDLAKNCTKESRK